MHIIYEDKINHSFTGVNSGKEQESKWKLYNAQPRAYSYLGVQGTMIVEGDRQEGHSQ